MLRSAVALATAPPASPGGGGDAARDRGKASPSRTKQRKDKNPPGNSSGRGKGKGKADVRVDPTDVAMVGQTETRRKRRGGRGRCNVDGVLAFTEIADEWADELQSADPRTKSAPAVRHRDSRERSPRRTASQLQPRPKSGQDDRPRDVAFALDQIVILHGLNSRYDLGGQRAFVTVLPTESKDRYAMRVESSGERLLVRE